MLAQSVATATKLMMLLVYALTAIDAVLLAVLHNVDTCTATGLKDIRLAIGICTTLHITTACCMLQPPQWLPVV